MAGGRQPDRGGARGVIVRCYITLDGENDRNREVRIVGIWAGTAKLSILRPPDGLPAVPGRSQRSLDAEEWQAGRL
jgi:hypothetical protein